MGKYDQRVDMGNGAFSGGGYPALPDDVVLFPNLVEFLTLDRFSDGTGRVHGTLRVFVEGGRLKVCFNDPACHRYAFRSVDSLDALLGTLERILAGDDLDWRPEKDYRGKR